MGVKCTMPADFAEHAREPVRDLTLRYQAANSTIRRWRKMIGVVVPCGAPKGNSNSVRNASRGKTTRGIDGPEQVAACLSCKRPRCPGSCPVVR